MQFVSGDLVLLAVAELVEPVLDPGDWSFVQKEYELTRPSTNTSVTPGKTLSSRATSIG